MQQSPSLFLVQWLLCCWLLLTKNVKQNSQLCLILKLLGVKWNMLACPESYTVTDLSKVRPHNPFWCITHWNSHSKDHMFYSNSYCLLLRLIWGLLKHVKMVVLYNLCTFVVLVHWTFNAHRRGIDIKCINWLTYIYTLHKYELLFSIFFVL